MYLLFSIAGMLMYNSVRQKLYQKYVSCYEGFPQYDEWFLYVQVYWFYQYLSSQANEVLIDPKCQLKTICKAGGTLVKKTLEPCEPNGICTVQNGKRACICKNGFVSYNGICIPTGI